MVIVNTVLNRAVDLYDTYYGKFEPLRPFNMDAIKENFTNTKTLKPSSGLLTVLPTVDHEDMFNAAVTALKTGIRNTIKSVTNSSMAGYFAMNELLLSPGQKMIKLQLYK